MEVRPGLEVTIGDRAGGGVGFLDERTRLGHVTR
jgi:hypothetical protein